MLVDAQALQYRWSAERGIGRYLNELLAAFRRSDHGVELSYVLNPELPVRPLLEPLIASGRITFSDRLRPEDGDVFHVPSPFEPAPIDRVWPSAVRGLPLVVTVHDLIPFVLTDLYLRNARELRWYRTRLELVKRAERVVAVSQSTADDVIEHAEVAPERIVVVGEGPAERFRPADDRAAALRALQRDLPEVQAGFVLYPGGMDPRKNIVRLLEAYSGLPSALRERHQLVVAGHLAAWDRRELDRLLRELALTEDVLFPGYLPDEALLLLYQCAFLTVFPSLYEGFGLPVAESIACGTPVIASNTSSIPELIENDEALFDPEDPGSIRETLARALEDGVFLETLRGARLDDRHSWAEAASGTSAVYVSASRARRTRDRSKPRLAVAASLSRRDAAASSESSRLLAALGRRMPVDAFLAESDAGYLPPGVERHRLANFDLVERARGGYDAVLCVLSEDASDVLALLQSKGGQLLLRTPSLVRLYGRLARTSPHAQQAFTEALRSMYGSSLPRELAETSPISPRAAESRGILMARDAVGRADRVFVVSHYASKLVELDAEASAGHKLEVLPVAFPEPGDGRAEHPARIVARVGNEDGPLRVVLEALAGAGADVELGIVIAREGRHLRSTLRRVADEYGIGSRMTLASERDRDVWRPWLSGALAAVQLAGKPELVPSNFLVEAIAAGLPTVVSDVGFARELPDDVVVKVPHEADADRLAAEIAALVDDPSRSASLRTQARAFARENSDDAVAAMLLRSLGLEPQDDAPAPRKMQVGPLLSLLDRPITVVDVGTRWGFDERWDAFDRQVELIGFEADAHECARLQMLYGAPNVRFVPTALGRSQGTAELHTAADPGSSSLLLPDRDASHDRPEVARIQSVGSTQVEVTTFDAWAAEEDIGVVDVMKLDVQGMELDVLAGAASRLESVRMLDVEVEFNEMYEGQPLFGDIDQFLRDRGFVLWRLGHLVHYGIKDESVRFELRDEQVFENRPVEFEAQGGQLYWGHAYYVPRGLAFGEIRQWTEHVADACIAVVYGFRDLAARSLRAALKDAPSEASARIQEVLANVEGSRQEGDSGTTRYDRPTSAQS